MRFVRENTAFFVMFILVGALLGSALGVFLVELIPSLRIVGENLLSVGFDIGVMVFHLRLNLMSIIGIIAGVFIFAKA